MTTLPKQIFLERSFLLYFRDIQNVKMMDGLAEQAQ